MRAAFSRHAAGYDAQAVVQRLVQDRVLGIALARAGGARRVLDVGAGTGALLARLAAARPGLVAAAIDLAPAMCVAARRAVPSALVAAADAEALPFRGGAFDLVVSTSAFQWLARLDAALAEARRVLAPGGTLCLALFGERTLRELRAAWRAAASGAAVARLHRFFSADEVARELAGAGLRVDALWEDEIVEHHPDARAVMRAVKAVGAASAAPGRRGLGGRAEILEALRRYDAHGGADGVPATYHVVVAVAGR